MAHLDTNYLTLFLFLCVAFGAGMWLPPPAIPGIVSDSDRCDPEECHADDPRYREFFATEEEIREASLQATMPMLPTPPKIPIKARRKQHREA